MSRAAVTNALDTFAAWWMENTEEIVRTWFTFVGIAIAVVALLILL